MIIQNNYENVLENEKLTQMKYKTIFSKEKDKKGKKDRIYVYFWLKFGLANAIDNYLRLQIRVVCVGNF